MKKQILLLCLLGLTFTACGQRVRTSQPTLPAPVLATTIATIAPATAPEQIPTTDPVIATPAPSQTVTQPAQPAPPPAATTPPESTSTVVPESDPLGDEVEHLLEQLDATNTAADSEIQQLPVP